MTRDSGPELAATRRALGISRDTLAGNLGRTPRWLMHIEEGRLPMSSDTATQITCALAAHAKDPGAVGAAFPGSDLTNRQLSNQEKI
jgi:DNA-binding XRE family transcriptional regulator